MEGVQDNDECLDLESSALEVYTTLQRLRNAYMLDILVVICEYHRKVKERFFEKQFATTLANPTDTETDWLQDIVEQELGDIEYLHNIDLTYESFISLFDDFFVESEECLMSEAEKTMEVNSLIQTLQTRYNNEIHSVEWVCDTVADQVKTYHDAFTRTLTTFQKRACGGNSVCEFCELITTQERTTKLSCGHWAHYSCAINIFLNEDFICTKCHSKVNL